MESAADTKARRGRPPRAEQVAARRRALLDAAGVVFRRDGFLAATVDAIAAEAGFTRGAVYSQFANKADLFLTLLEERIEARAAGNEAATAHVTDATDASAFLRQAVSASVDPGWRLAVLEFRIAAAREPALNARYAQVHRRAIDSVGRALAAVYDGLGMAPPLPIDVLASTALAMEDGGFLEAIVRGEGLPPDTIVAVVALQLGFPPSPTPPEAP
jgi:AcrR family transcriptional regulator